MELIEQGERLNGGFIKVKILLISITKLTLLTKRSRFLMEQERNYDNDGLDPSEEYFRRKKKGNDEDTYFPLEESEPPHY